MSSIIRKVSQVLRAFPPYFVSSFALPTSLLLLLTLFLLILLTSLYILLPPTSPHPFFFKFLSPAPTFSSSPFHFLLHFYFSSSAYFSHFLLFSTIFHFSSSSFSSFFKFLSPPPTVSSLRLPLLSLCPQPSTTLHFLLLVSFNFFLIFLLLVFLFL